MANWLSKLLDKLSDFLSHRKGLLPLIGLALVFLNLLLRLIIPQSWLVDADLFLHVGVIIAILGFLLSAAL
jgi:hypothetical protein